MIQPINFIFRCNESKIAILEKEKDDALRRDQADQTKGDWDKAYKDSHDWRVLDDALKKQQQE